MIKPWVDLEIGDPAGSFLHSERQPLESRIGILKERTR
jgi:hypothetical protein